MTIKYTTEGQLLIEGDAGESAVAVVWIAGRGSVKLHIGRGNSNSITLSAAQLKLLAQRTPEILKSIEIPS